jgi:8-oxo-dGTP pyrophosphatase MutT (NUDIX family)
MIIKVYFGDKPVFLCDDIDDTLHEYLHHPDTIFLDEVSGPAIKSLIHEIVKPDFHAGILWSEDIEALKKAFWKHFTIIHAGGGLVENENGEVLLIFRRGIWDLPKGKQDEGETIEQCAIREVQEETGLQQVTSSAFLVTTYHTYNDYGHSVLKESYWFRMKASSSEALVPQTIEDIHEIKWVPKSALVPFLEKTFPSVRDVLKFA